MEPQIVNDAAIYFENWRDVDADSWRARWPNFSPIELACPHCGALLIDVDALDHLQAARYRYGEAVSIASAYRCPDHPIERAKKAPGSHSRGAAFDAYAIDMRAWLGELMKENPMGIGMGIKDGSFHFHVDWDEVYGPRVWGY